MSAITIDKDLHKEILKQLRNEYVHEFGIDSVMNVEENQKKFTREEYILTYAKNIIFWKTRIPEIDPDKGIDMKEITMHAICTNSVQNLNNKIKQMKIEKEVENKINSLTVA